VLILNRRSMERCFPEGSVTEVELGADAMVLKRPDRTREVPYQSISRVRASGSLLALEVRGRRPMVELLPLDLLPDDALEFIRVRGLGAWPATDRLGDGTPSRRFVVPAGWAAHVAAVQTRENLRHAGLWIRIGTAIVLSMLLATIAGSWWPLVLAPLLSVASAWLGYTRTRRAVGLALPAGSVAATETRDDRLVSRNAGGVREIRFDDIRSLVVRDDVVLLGMTSGPKVLALARDLVPDELLQRHQLAR